MSFNSYEELMEAVSKRRQSDLVIEVDMGGEYSQEHEDAKKELQQAKAMQALTGKEFLADNMSALEARVEETRPSGQPVWIKFKRLDLMEWAVLVKQSQMNPIDQFEKVLPKTFVGVYNSPDATEPLSTDHRLLSSKGDMGILPGGAMHAVVQSFMSWQNSGGEVTIHPTKSGQD